MAVKNLYWFKLKNTYFNQLVQKKMKRQQNGKDMQIIYLRMLLLSLDNQGYIHYQGVYGSIEEELAEEFDESVELIKETIDFLVSNNMIVQSKTETEESYYMPEAIENTGKECESAERVRKYRERKTLHCNDGVTQGNDSVTVCNKDKSKRRIREDKEIRVREDKELDNTLYNSLTLKENAALPSADAGNAHSSFTLIDCQQCANEGKVNLSETGVVAFFERMQKDGWKIKNRPVTNLLLAMRGFAKYYKKYQKNTLIKIEETDNQEKVINPDQMEEVLEQAQEEYEPTEEEYTEWLKDMGFNPEEKQNVSS